MDKDRHQKGPGRHREKAEEQPRRQSRRQLGYGSMAEGKGQGGNEDGKPVTEGSCPLEDGSPEKEFLKDGG